MPIRKVIRYGHPSLRRKAKPVVSCDASLLKLAKDMVLTLDEEGGVGLAAPQIDIPLSLIVINLSTEKVKLDPMIIVNPVVLEASVDQWDYEEGCLSIPQIHQSIKRSSCITVEGLNVEGKPIVIKNAEGLLSRVLLHEIDHLQGKLFVDYLSEEQKKEIKAALSDMAKASKQALRK
jgi:peptide deformylase